jgi:hypothetical protein
MTEFMHARYSIHPRQSRRFRQSDGAAQRGIGMKKIET